MFIVAGPPGSGKSDAFRLREFGVDFFNADDRAAELNGNSYHRIPLEIRSQVNREFEAFIEDHIDRRISFAFETTLRTSVTFAQARHAHANGFIVSMSYVALNTVELNLDRIELRSKLGFHSAPAEVLRDIHARSLENLNSPSATVAFRSTVWLSMTTRPSASRLNSSPKSNAARWSVSLTAFQNGFRTQCQECSFLRLLSDSDFESGPEYTVAMPEQAEDKNSLDEVKEKIAEVIEILNQPNIPLVIPADGAVAEGERAGDASVT
jgi:predicted ABC-type ATPase